MAGNRKQESIVGMLIKIAWKLLTFITIISLRQSTFLGHRKPQKVRVSNVKTVRKLETFLKSASKMQNYAKSNAVVDTRWENPNYQAPPPPPRRRCTPRRGSVAPSEGRRVHESPQIEPSYRWEDPQPFQERSVRLDNERSVGRGGEFEGYSLHPASVRNSRPLSSQRSEPVEPEKTCMEKFIGKHEVPPLWKGCGRILEAEYWGTFLLVLLGVASCVDVGAPPDDDFGFSKLISVSFVFGIAVATIAQTLGHVSGAHLNPAVSFGLVAAGECGIIKASLYTLFQILGATIGALFAKSFFLSGDKGHQVVGSCSAVNTAKIAVWQGVFVEMFITFPLIFVICAAACDKDRTDVKGSAPLAIGLAITLGHLVGVPVTGASMNPARSIGPLVVAIIAKNNESKEALANCMSHIWVYLIGPTLGGILAGLLYRFRFAQRLIAS